MKRKEEEFRWSVFFQRKRSNQEPKDAREGRESKKQLLIVLSRHSFFNQILNFDGSFEHQVHTYVL